MSPKDKSPFLDTDFVLYRGMGLEEEDRVTPAELFSGSTGQTSGSKSIGTQMTRHSYTKDFPREKLMCFYWHLKPNPNSGSTHSWPSVLMVHTSADSTSRGWNFGYRASGWDEPPVLLHFTQTSAALAWILVSKGFLEQIHLRY